MSTMVAQHVLIHLSGVAVFDVNVHHRINLHEFCEVRRQIVQADAVDRRHTNRAGNDVLQFLQFAVQRVVGLDDLLAIIIEYLAFARQARILFAALDEHGFEDASERTELLAHGRLGHVVDLGGLGKALGIGQIAEYFKTFNLHKRSEYEIQLFINDIQEPTAALAVPVWPSVGGRNPICWRPSGDAI
jgi:hypothetical protein